MFVWEGAVYFISKSKEAMDRKKLKITGLNKGPRHFISLILH